MFTNVSFFYLEHFVHTFFIAFHWELVTFPDQRAIVLIIIQSYLTMPFRWTLGYGSITITQFVYTKINCIVYLQYSFLPLTKIFDLSITCKNGIFRHNSWNWAVLMYCWRALLMLSAEYSTNINVRSLRLLYWNLRFVQNGDKITKKSSSLALSFISFLPNQVHVSSIFLNKYFTIKRKSI